MVTDTAVEKGYKQTEMGVIPEDWGVKELKEIVTNVIDNRGKTPPYSNIADIELIETASISFVNQYPDYSKVSKFVSKEVYNYWFRGHPIKNDILISTVGEYSGASAIMKENRGTIAQNLIAIRTKEIDPTYLFYWTRSKNFKKQLNQVMMNQAQPSLRVPWLLNFYITFPKNEPEQSVIVTVLSDTDALIGHLEKLITKKKVIKQGAMQLLLTGEKRLPGFTNNWEMKRLDKYGAITMGQSPPGNSYNEKEIGSPLLNGASDLKEDRIFVTQYTTKPTRMSKKEDLLFCIRATIGNLQISDKEYCLGRGVAALTVNNEYNYKFISYQLQSLFELMRNQSQGGVIKGLRKDELCEFSIPTPIIDEQNAIAQILSDMDDEIIVLEQKRDKYKMIKQGMMQQLLTGKIRLL